MSELQRVDHCTSAHGLEARVTFLDLLFINKYYLSPSIQEVPLDDTTEDQNKTNLSGSEMAKQTTKKPDILFVSNRILAKRQTCCQQ